MTEVWSKREREEHNSVNIGDWVVLKNEGKDYSGEVVSAIAGDSDVEYEVNVMHEQPLELMPRGKRVTNYLHYCYE